MCKMYTVYTENETIFKITNALQLQEVDVCYP